MRHYDKCTMLRVEPTERDGRKDDVAPVLGREDTLVVAPFCDLSRGSSASLTWSDLANPRINRVIGSSEPLTWSQLASLGNDLGGITWREYEDSGKRKNRTRYEPRLAPPTSPANGKKSKKTAGTESTLVGSISQQFLRPRRRPPSVLLRPLP